MSLYSTFVYQYRCMLNAGLLLVRLFAASVSGAAAEVEAPLMAADHPNSPLAEDVLLHTDEEPLVLPRLPL